MPLTFIRFLSKIFCSLAIAVLFHTRQGFASLAAWISRSPSVSTQFKLSEGNVPGYVSNQGSQRERDVASQGHISGIHTRALLHS